MQNRPNSPLAALRADRNLGARRSKAATLQGPPHSKARHNRGVTTKLIYLTDAYLREFDATVTEVDAVSRRVELDRTAFYATGGGQPHDTGTLAGLPVVDVRKEGDHVWHTLGGDGPLPGPG